MNKNLFRIIFNQHRGQRMAVAEPSSSQGKAANGPTQAAFGSASLCTDAPMSKRMVVSLGAVSLAVLSAIGAVVLLLPSPASAQVVAYRNAPGNQQPTVLQTANGVPQVNIQTPSAAGVSRNVYSQFDVQSNGVILNNSRTNVQTEQGGWVQGNPWLATGSARVILNEVNSSNPSYLNGYVEVAGQRAEVVIANPSGISVNGGGFINASKATLTTGTPIVNSGSLDGYRVQGGNVSINGNGLDLSTTDYAAILARAVQVNAGIWANELKVVTGANQIDASSLAANTTPVTTTIAGIGSVPSFALDVAQIGGMYAGKIHLIGTELGLGVRSAGTIGSTGGDLVLQNSGWLTTTGTLRANGNVSISTAGNLDSSSTGVIAATGNVALNVATDVSNAGLISASNTLNVSSANINNSVTGELSGTTTQLSATQTLTNRGLINGIETQLNATTLNNIGTGRIYGDRLSVAAVNLNNDVETIAGVTKTGTLAARERLDLGISGTLTNREHALIYSVGDMGIGGALDAATRRATGSANTVNNNSATVEAGGNLSLSSATLNNTNEHFTTRVDQVAGPTTKNLTVGQYHVDHQTTTYNTVVNEYETKVDSSDPAQILAGGNMQLKGQNLTNDKSKIIAGGSLTGDLTNLNNIQAIGEHRVTESGTITLTTHHWEGGWGGRGNYWTDDTTAYNPPDVVTSITLPVTYALQHTTPTSNAANAIANLTTLPTGSLYHSNPSLTAAYLVEVDSRFTDRNLWLGSDFMMQSLSLDPNVTQKRLGDGFYEQKLIREQVAQLTGRRFLADYTSDDQEYKALMTSAITFGQTYNLRPGIALSAQQVAQLTSDIVWLVEQTVTLPDGSSQKVLVPQLYVRTQPGDLDGSGTLLAGKDVNINLSGDLTNSGTIAGRKVVSLTAENVNNLGGRMSGNDVSVAARQDLNSMGESISAFNSLSATAGRDLSIQTTTQNTQTAMGSRTAIDRVAGLYVSGSNGTLVASAGRDLNIVAGVVSNAGSRVTSLSAGNNFTLASVKTSDQLDVVWNANNYNKSSSSTDVGSTITSGGNTTLQAGHTLKATAANVQAASALNVNATDVNIQAGQATQASDQARQTTSKGFLSSTTVTTRDTSSSTTAVASDFGGNTVNINASNDIGIKGSNVVGDSDTSLIAKNNVTIEAAQNTSSSSSFRKETSSGLMSGGGLSISYGNQMQSSDGKDATTTAAASTVGSINGNVNISSGNQYKQVGSDVLTPGGDIAITAKKVDIVEARETNKQSSEQKFEQSGLTLSLSSPVLSAVQTAQAMSKAASQTSDTRMKTLAAASTALAASQAAAAVAAGQGDANGQLKNADGSMVDANAADKAGGISIAISLGSSKSSSQQTSQTDTARGSSVNAGGNVNISATGSGVDSNLTIQGSDIKAGNVGTLQADNQVNLLAAANTNTQTNSQNSSSASVGVGFSLGGQSNGFTINASASKAQGNGNGSETTYSNTHVAANQVDIKSGGDTTLKGATVNASTVKADVGTNGQGDLNIESLQDSATYAEKSSSAGVGVSLCIPPFCVGTSSVNVNAGKTKIDSDYASVTEQSGIKAGDGGFQVNVQGNTALVGGAITSTQAAVDQNKNTFQTGGTLTTSDIQNKASYEASSVSVSVGTSMAANTPMSMNGVGVGNKSDSAASTTAAGISGVAGDKAKRTGDKETGIAKIFNKDEIKADVQAQVAITQEFGKQASKAAGDYAAAKLDEAKKNNDQAGIDAWKEGGANRVALHTAIGGLTGGTAGAVGAGTSQTVIDQVGEALRGADLPLEVKQSLIAAAGTAIGAAASSGSVAGGASAFNATANNYLYAYDGKIIARDKVDNNKVIVLSDKDKQKLAAQEPAVLMKEVAGINSDGAPVVVKDERAQEMTDSTTYNLANAKDKAQLQESTDMGYINTDDKNTRIYVQTGMDTKPEDALKNAQLLSKVVGESVGVIVNGTEGLPKDLQEYLPKAPSIKDALNEYTYQTLNKQGDKLVVMHSAGNEDANKALQLGQQLGHQYSNLSFVSLGSPVSNSIMRQNVTQTQAQYLGQVNDWRDPVTNPTLWVTGTAALLAGGAAAGVALAPATGGGSMYVYFSSLIGGGIGSGIGGGIGGGAGVYGINNYHPMDQYIAKPQAQSIMFNWQAKQGK